MIHTWPDDYMLEAAMGIISNVGPGDWGTQTAEWQDAARKWMDAYGRSIKTPAPRQGRLLPASWRV